MAYIYILHFNEALAHAKHYVGCTTELEKRLVAHAKGKAANLTRVLKDLSIEWRLSTLLTTSKRNMRTLERRLKDIANTARYCNLCSKTPSALPGTKSYPIEQLPFATHSRQLAFNAPDLLPAVVRFTNKEDSIDLLHQVKDLMSLDKDALGFIPAGGEAGLKRLLATGQIVLTTIGNNVIAYAAYTVNTERDRVTIHQACTRDGFRFLGLGKRMVNMIREKWPNAYTIAKVRNDLAANEFWIAIGFEFQSFHHHKTSNNVINLYRAEPKGV